jgi:prepilin peptidase CpaA
MASLIGLLAWAAVTDYRTYLIPNRISLAIAALYPVYVMTQPADVDWQGALVVASAFLVIGVLLFRFGIVGGGDIKLLTAMALWVGPGEILAFLFITAIAGLALTVLTISHLRYLRPWPAPALASDEAAVLKLRQSVPYGIAIALGGILTVLRLFGS